MENNMNVYENRPGIELVTGYELEVVGEHVGGGFSWSEAGVIGVSCIGYLSQMLDYMDATQGVAAFAIIVGVMFNGFSRSLCITTLGYARDRYTPGSIGYNWYNAARLDLQTGITLASFVQNVKDSKYGPLP